MSLITRLVRVNLDAADGAVIAGVTVEATLTVAEIDGLMVVPTSITALTDVNGSCLLNLWPNERGVNGSQYRIKARQPGGTLILSTLCTVPDGNVLTEVPLSSIITAPPYPALDSALQAVINAQAQADAATTQALAAAASAVAADASADAAALSQVSASDSAVSADADAITATTQADIATAQALAATTNGAAQVALAATQADTATTQAGVAATSAAAANTAKDLAITAWAASTSPAETLAAISKTIHTGSIVKAIIYDTSKDSDGGAWRKRCADKSWYTEALGFTGTYGGECASNAAGWAACGSVVGGAYKSTADGKFYTPLSSSTQTEIFRGNVREFPAVVAIVAESSRVVIYDLTQTGCPMWMVFVGNTLTTHLGYFVSARPLTSVAALNGTVCTPTNLGGMGVISFASDSAAFRSISNSGSLPTNIANRNANTVSSGSLANILSTTVNDVAITVLDGAPVATATGLPVPTIAVATAAGVSVIKDDGTVVNNTYNTWPIAFLAIVSGRLYGSRNGSIGWTMGYGPIRSMVTGTAYATAYSAGTTPNLSDGGSTKLSNSCGGALAICAPNGYAPSISLFKENPVIQAKGMVAYINNAYNSGWMPGDIRGAHLADTVAGTITASGELVTNGTFATDTDWTKHALTTISGGAAVFDGVTSISSSEAAIYQTNPISVVAGRLYAVAYTITGGTTNSISVGFGGANPGVARLAAGTYTDYLVAPSGSVYLSVLARGAVGVRTGGIDNISVKLAEPDRSVKASGLVVNGTLTKTAVATGAALVAWSGFSASNYLEQPYSSDLDFSTTGFSGVLWLTEAPNSAIEYLINRDSPTPAAAIRLWVSVAGFLVFELYDGTTTRTATGTVAIDDSTRKCVMFDYSAGTLNIYVNNVLYATATGTALLTLNNAAATLRIGESKAGSQPLTNGSIALVRLSATVMSADQREHIYRTELPLFQANAQCCIAGTSTAVTALAYDEDTDLLHVGTSWGRSGFKDLLRIDSEATTTGALTSLSASGGTVLTGGTAAKVYQPALLLRDELRRKSEARKALGRIPVFFDYTATASQTAFVVPKGYTANALYKNGTLMRETTTGVYWTRSNNGFAETCTLSTGATVSDWISIMCVRA
mgnify:CR=1 FL=1